MLRWVEIVSAAIIRFLFSVGSTFGAFQTDLRAKVDSAVGNLDQKLGSLWAKVADANFFFFFYFFFARRLQVSLTLTRIGPIRFRIVPDGFRSDSRWRSAV